MKDYWEVLTEHLPEFSSGFFVTFRLVAFALVVALLVGTIVAALRVGPVRWLRWVGGIYVETFRNLPLLVLLLILFSGLRRAGLSLDPWVAGILGLGLYTAAYIAEALRSGVFAVGKGQIEASLSIGLTYPQTLRWVVIPQAFRTVIPAIGSLVIAMIKNSAVVGASIIALPDILGETREINSITFRSNEAFFWGAVGYLILTGAATLLFRYLEARYRIRR